ncbi:hypothetical protein NP233_g3733 [Leucocoprinus birnbaumii]|uniref:Uncharacterized protein n=1 Tax=Leucocoprinus birnbaumii TaxID=56174 RepID=A0AAD5VWH4_9AGAR|nr:hypothetical protein NP233_g3733 [Leucocoprinus birnbaumii]
MVFNTRRVNSPSILSIGSEVKVQTLEEPGQYPLHTYSTYSTSEDNPDSELGRLDNIIPAHCLQVPNTSLVELLEDSLTSEWSTPPLSPGSSESTFSYFEENPRPRSTPPSSARDSTPSPRPSSSNLLYGPARTPPELISRSTTVVGLETLNVAPHHHHLYSSFTKQAGLSRSGAELSRWLHDASRPATGNYL